MRSYEVRFNIPGSGAGNIVEVVQATSDHQARRIIQARYSGNRVVITSVRSLQ